jgi:hypothetical protein
MSESNVLLIRGTLLVAQLVLLIVAVQTPGVRGLVLDAANLGCLATQLLLRGKGKKEI